MAKYRVISASVNIHAGVLGLEPHQARARLHRLKPLGGNCYEVLDPPVTFKRGEEFEYEGELPKHLVESVASCPVPVGAETFTEFDVLMPADRETEIELSETAMPDDGVTEAPPKRKKGARGAKPAA